MTAQLIFLPRLIRMKNAPAYLGMEKHTFNRTVRPFIKEIRIGTQGIAFDRLDLDAWVEDNKYRDRCPVFKKRREDK